MPVSEHFQGHGDKVMSSMKKTYGPEKAKRVFYMTENKRANEGKLPMPKRRLKAMGKKV